MQNSYPVSLIYSYSWQFFSEDSWMWFLCITITYVFLSKGWKPFAFYILLIINYINKPSCSLMIDQCSPRITLYQTQIHLIRNDWIHLEKRAINYIKSWKLQIYFPRINFPISNLLNVSYQWLLLKIHFFLKNMKLASWYTMSNICYCNSLVRYCGIIIWFIIII